MADTAEPEAPPLRAEPVKVRPMSEIQERVAEEMTTLRRELDGLVVADEEGLRVFQKHVTDRIDQWRREGVSHGVLYVLLVERLCGVSDKKAVTVPRKILNRRVATR